MIGRVLSGACAFLAAGCSFELGDRHVFHPQAKVASWGDQPHDGIAGERYFVDAAGYPFEDHGLVAAVAHRAPGDLRLSLVTLADPPAEDRPLVVHCFGNGSDRWFAGLKHGRKIVPYGDVLLFDYPGYNGAPGEPSAAAMTAQADTLSAYVREEFAGRRRVYWGHSLGGFVCAELASRDQSASGLILETTAPDVDAVAKAWTPWFLKPFVRIKPTEALRAFDTPKTAAATGLPILVIGAGRDDVLPVKLSRLLAERLEAAGADPQYVELPEADHFDAGDQPGFDPAVRTFLAQIAR